MIVTQDELQKMVAEVVHETVKATAQEFKNQLSAMGISLTPQASIHMDVDQKSVKPSLHIYSNTSIQEINDMIGKAIKGLENARTEINTKIGKNLAAPLPVVEKKEASSSPSSSSSTPAHGNNGNHVNNGFSPDNKEKK